MSAVIVLAGIICGHTSATTVVEIPQSQNVSAGQEVEFTCATTSSDNTIAWSFSKNISIGSVTSIQSMLPGGGTRSTRRFTASVAHNQSTVTCIVLSGGTAESYMALLLVQGN